MTPGSVRATFLAACGYAAALSGCSEGLPPDAGPADPVVVYASYQDKSYLPLLFEAYTEETGAAVIVRQGTTETIVEDIIDNDISPPADVLITPSVLGVHRAAGDGALRPISSEILGRVAPQLRDADGFWMALSYRPVVLVYNAAGAADVRSVTDLAGPTFRGRLCLSSSSEPMNRLLIANLVSRLGAREAELVVRGWIDNLARPVFASEPELLDALAGGACEIGLVSGWPVLMNGGVSASPMQRKTLFDAVDIEGIGMARHARNPDGALRLIEWLLSDDVQARHAVAVSASPASEPYDRDPGVGAAAWLAADAALLAERARYP